MNAHVFQLPGPLSESCALHIGGCWLRINLLASQKRKERRTEGWRRLWVCKPDGRNGRRKERGIEAHAFQAVKPTGKPGKKASRLKAKVSILLSRKRRD